jgi:hypothetical protein
MEVSVQLLAWAALLIEKRALNTHVIRLDARWAI